MFYALERKLLGLFVSNMQIKQALARIGKAAEVRRERDARQLAFQVRRKSSPVAGMMKQRVNVIEDVPLCDPLIAVLALKANERRERNVLPAIAAVLIVGVEGEALRRGAEATTDVFRWNPICRDTTKGSFRALVKTNQRVFCSRPTTG